MKTILILLFPLLLQAQIGPENEMMDMEPGTDMVTWIKSLSKPNKSNSMPETLNLELYYPLFLEKINLKESDMPPIQKSEMKKAFMGGVGTMLMIMRDEIPNAKTEEDSIKMLEDLFDQVEKFWISQIKLP